MPLVKKISKKMFSIGLSAIILFSPVISMAEVDQGSLTPVTTWEDSYKEFNKNKRIMTIDEKISHLEVMIAGTMRDHQSALDANIMMDGEYNMIFNSEGGGDLSYSSLDSGISYNYGTIQETVYFTLTQKYGFSPAAAAGIMGNIQQECSFNPNLEEKTTRAEKGYGLVQWTFGRRTAYENYARSKGKPARDIETQVDYLVWEMQNTQNHYIGKQLNVHKSKSYDAFRKINDPKVASEVFCWGFERPNKKLANMANRNASARKFYDYYSKQNPHAYNSVRNGSGLNANEQEYVEYAKSFEIDAKVPGGTRINLLNRLEKTRGAKVSKNARNVQGIYDAPSFVDRTTAYITGTPSPGGALKGDIYVSGAPFRLYGYLWNSSRFNLSDQYNEDKDKGNIRFVEISKSDLKPGDIMYVNTGEKAHMAFYMPGDRVFGAMNEALGVNWGQQKGPKAINYYTNFYRTMWLSDENTDEVNKKKKEVKDKTATSKDARSGISGYDGEGKDRPSDQIGNDLYKWNSNTNTGPNNKRFDWETENGIPRQPDYNSILPENFKQF